MTSDVRRRKASAHALAKALAVRFLAEGNFVDSGGPMSLKPAPALANAWVDSAEIGFAGLSVQAVGFAEGSLPDEPDVTAEEPQDEVHVFVTRGGKKELSAIPDELGGVRIVVHNTGKVTVKPKAASAASNRGNLFEHGGRIACGSSCAPSGKRYAGTLGALVKKNGASGLFALSNNHVFADCNHVPVGIPIMSPADMDARPAPARPPGKVCEQFDIVELRSGSPVFVDRCRVDLAIAAVPDDGLVSSWQGDDSDGYDTPTSVATPQRRLLVKKFGRTTGLTHGIMLARVIEFDLPYQAENFSALVWFEDVWAVRSVDSEPFALGGDSGSLVVTEDGSAVVGMVFATAPKGAFAYIVPAASIVSEFGGLTFVGNHGT